MTSAENIEKLPAGKNSVKGVGRTHPDPAESIILPTGTEVPAGKGVDAKIEKSALLYNEYPFFASTLCFILIVDPRALPQQHKIKQFFIKTLYIRLLCMPKAQ